MTIVLLTKIKVKVPVVPDPEDLSNLCTAFLHLHTWACLQNFQNEGDVIATVYWLDF